MTPSVVASHALLSANSLSVRKLFVISDKSINADIQLHWFSPFSTTSSVFSLLWTQSFFALALKHLPMCADGVKEKHQSASQCC